MQEIEIVQRTLETAPAFPWLSVITWLPIVGALVLVIIPRNHESLLKGVAIAWTAITGLLSLGMLTSFRSTSGRFQLTETHSWIEGLGIRYALGIDGISLFLVLLTTLLLPLVILGAWSSIERRVKEFLICLLVLETSVLGTLLALDLFLFYLFWELMLVPMFLLIGVWGGTDRIRATIKFLLSSVVGSLAMLISILYLHHKLGAFHGSGRSTFLLTDFYGLEISLKEQLYLFGGFGLAFAIKIPLVPFHTWLPRAQVEAPTAGAVVLAGLLLKMGTYGLARFAMPLFPDAVRTLTPYLATLAVVGVIYGALLALAQSDIKRLVAYTSISHLGLVVLGLVALTPQAVQGATLHMVNHGLWTGALFLMVGMIYERRHTRLMGDFGGLCRVMPRYSVMLMIVMLASIGLPGTSGFVGEFLILMGTFAARGFHDLRWAAAISAFAAILAAVYMLGMFQKVMFGPVIYERNRDLRDIGVREWATLAPMVALVIVIGLFPALLLRPMEASVDRLLKLSHATVLPQGDAWGHRHHHRLEARMAARHGKRLIRSKRREVAQ